MKAGFIRRIGDLYYIMEFNICVNWFHSSRVHCFTCLHDSVPLYSLMYVYLVPLVLLI